MARIVTRLIKVHCLTCKAETREQAFHEEHINEKARQCHGCGDGDSIVIHTVRAGMGLRWRIVL